MAIKKTMVVIVIIKKIEKPQSKSGNSEPIDK